MSNPRPGQSRALPRIEIRPLREADLGAADRIFRVAFGTFLGLSRPEEFAGDADYVRTRWRADPQAAFAAERDGELVASNFVTTWGSVGFFGPLTVKPELWDQGIAKQLLQPTIELFERRGTRLEGLFTFAHSAKHVGLYQSFGFWPRFLTAVMSNPVEASPSASSGSKTDAKAVSTFSASTVSERRHTLEACRALSGAIFEGLDLGHEIEAVLEQELGDTVLVWSDSRLAAFAVCHCGPRTEAGSGACYVKFGAVRPGPAAPPEFERLLDACESLARSRELGKLVAGANAGRPEAWAALHARGFRTELQGVAMQRRNEPGYNRPGVFVIDDWR
jgi:predicted N-acetyltransferase YhbS